MAKLLLVLAAAVAVCAATSLREKRQVGFNCQNQNGPIADQTDCSFFIQCDNGIGTRKGCPAGLEFNPQANYCDWPSNMPNPQCNRVSPSTQRNAACGGATGVVLIEHATFCNGFMFCGNGFLMDGCQFCGDGLYFDTTSKKCIMTFNVNLATVCNGRNMVPGISQETSKLEGSCWPSYPNIYKSLLDKIQG